MPAIDNAMTLWSWPWLAMRWNQSLAETWFGASQVVAARLPIIGAAWSNPLGADTQELGRMVSEKSEAFGDSARATSHAGDAVYRSAALNLDTWNRLARGSLVWPSQWLRVAEQSLAAAAALTALPGATLAPVHARVTANAKRLGR
jgi:hypothetical protein